MYKKVKSVVLALYAKYIALPDPKKLGMSDFNALESRAFSFDIDPRTPTWEDWENEVRMMYPIRWLFAEELPKAFRPIKVVYRWVKDAWYWVRCHTYNRYHIVDIREENVKRENYPPYRWGYIDPTERLLLAAFAVFVDFYKNEHQENLKQIDPAFHAEELKEIEELYYWWTKGRFEENDACHNLYLLQRKYFDEKNKAEHAKASAAWLAMRDALEKREQEMLSRLVNIRGRMWS